MRRFLLVSCVFTFCTGTVYSSSFVTLDVATQSASTIKIETQSNGFDLYGPSGPNCDGPDCPTMAELERLARKGVSVLKISGGDVSELNNVFPIPPQKELANNLEMQPDNYKTGPLPDGLEQEAVLGVETELLPDITPEFEPETVMDLRARDNENDYDIRVDASDESMNALIGAL